MVQAKIRGAQNARNVYLAELFKRDFAVAILVRVHDGLVDNLLKLRIFQVIAHHHLEHLARRPVTREHRLEEQVRETLKTRRAKETLKTRRTR